MKVKVGDNVRIIAGKDKGKEGKVIKTYKNDNKVVVEGLNIVSLVLQKIKAEYLILKLLFMYLT